MRFTLRSDSVIRTLISANCERNSFTTGTTCRRPNTIGAVRVRWPGHAIFAGCLSFGFADRFENAPARGKVADPGLGQDELACRTHEQPRLEVCLKIPDLAADSWKRNAELAAGSRKAACFRGSDQNRHGVQAVHSSLTL